MKVIDEYFDVSDEYMSSIYPDDEIENYDDSYCWNIDDEYYLSDPEDISPINYTYEKTKSILENLNMKHLEKFMREMKIKNINKK